MNPATRIGCVVCDEPFVTGDFPDIAAWVDPGGVQCAAHESCLDRLGEFVDL